MIKMVKMPAASCPPCEHLAEWGSLCRLHGSAPDGRMRPSLRGHREPPGKRKVPPLRRRVRSGFGRNDREFFLFMISRRSLVSGHGSRSRFSVSVLGAGSLVSVLWSRRDSILDGNFGGRRCKAAGGVVAADLRSARRRNR
jgi:hypothetical protein